MIYLSVAGSSVEMIRLMLVSSQQALELGCHSGRQCER